MIWVDVKYANLLSVQLDLYKVKQQSPYLASFRCPICGDSRKSRTKTRGFFYANGNDLWFKCHNCQAAHHFNTFLKITNEDLYKQYAMEVFREKHGERKLNTEPATYEFDPPDFSAAGLLDRMLPRISSLPKCHEAVEYCRKRNLPRDSLDRLYFIEHSFDIARIADRYEGIITGKEPRIVIPAYSRGGLLTGITCRAIRGEEQRYVVARLNEQEPMVHFIDEVDFRQRVYVLEGAFDALFIKNSVAVGGSDLKKVMSVLTHVDVALIFDNQPRNKEVVKIMERTAKLGYPIVVWPDTINGKDINEMIENGMTRDSVMEVINTNTFQGLSLVAKLGKWRKR